jgi:cyclopropane fatty-acyl-phospholipid synthase-like methyltransferase
MRERGVRNAFAADLRDFGGGPFDTIICLCNGLDKVESLANMPAYLQRMKRLLAPSGQLLADSFDLRVGASAASMERFAYKAAAGRYFGEFDLQFEYCGERGAAFSVLQIDYETLSTIAVANGWRCALLKQAGAHYLARLEIT